MEVAIIGSGIAGISTSLFLSKKHNVTIYERNNYIGGHTNTKKVIIDNKEINVDTGFIVFNKLNYPNLLTIISLMFSSLFCITYMLKEGTMNIFIEDEMDLLVVKVIIISHKCRQENH